MTIACSNCHRVNELPDPPGNIQYSCFYCRALLPTPPAASGETSTAVGLIGGAALGAALGGPPGAIIGAVIGAILGGQAKGVG